MCTTKKNEETHEVLNPLLLVFIAFSIWFLIGTIINERKYSNLKKEAIAIGVAEYNGTNGNWQWKTNK